MRSVRYNRTITNKIAFTSQNESELQVYNVLRVYIYVHCSILDVINN